MAHPLREYRKRLGITLHALADRTGLSKPTLPRIETGKQKTTQVTIERIVEATGGAVTANDFVTKADPQPLAGPESRP